MSTYSETYKESVQPVLLLPLDAYYADHHAAVVLYALIVTLHVQQDNILYILMALVEHVQLPNQVVMVAHQNVMLNVNFA
jgi:hypothetical protein